MKARNALRAMFTLGVAFLSLSARAASPPSQFSLTAAVDHSVGTYGQPSPTEIWYVPLIARYDATAYVLKLTVPYVSITGNGTAVPGGVVFDSESSDRVTSSGLGDVMASASYGILRGSGAVPWMDATAVVKLGTADRKQQLGTGADDYAIQFDAYQRYGDWTPFATVGYKVPGSPPGLHLNSVYYGTLGAMVATAPSTNLGVMWNGQEALTSSSFAQSLGMVFLGWTLNPEYMLQFYVGQGIEKGSPDVDMGATVTRNF